MDSQHRHELQHNELEKLLVRLNQFLEKHGNKISIGICVVTAVLVGSILWYRNSKAQENAAWALLNSASGPDDLVEVWDRHPGSAAATWAKLLEAEQRMSQGIQAMFLDNEAGRADLEKSSKTFQNLSEMTSAPPEIRERALFGLARTQESLSDGSLKDATATYQRLLEKFPESFYKDDAKRRLAALAEGGSSDFYQWFASFERPKPKDQKPRDTGILDDGADDLLRRVMQNSGAGGGTEQEGEEATSAETGDEAAEAGQGGLTPPPPAEETSEPAAGNDESTEAPASTPAESDEGPVDPQGDNDSPQE